MTTPYNQGIFREGIGSTVGDVSDSLVPEPLSASILQELPKHSSALALMRRIQMSTKTQRMPVLDVLPFAYWVGGDTGLKQTTNMEWKNVDLIVEELATIVPIPQAYLDDAQVPIWSEVQPRLAEAVGLLIDQAIFWGVNKPSTWGAAIVPQAAVAGNVVAEGTGVDFAQDITLLGEKMDLTGYSINGFVVRPGMRWRLTGLRSAQGIPIFNQNYVNPNQAPGPATAIYGYPASMADNGAFDMSVAQLVTGDFSKAIIGMRQDMTYKMFDQAVISDDTGKVILNLMQQDAVAMRLVMRLAYATVNPVTTLQRGTRTITGAGTTSGSATVTTASALAADVGAEVEGPGIPAETRVVSAVPGTSLTLSNNATATAAVTVKMSERDATRFPFGYIST
jgi:HK97 family phage major capsid protein